MDYIKIPDLDPYPLSELQDTDLFEVCFYNGTTFLTKKITGAQIKAAVSGAASWGSITGTLSNQTDLQNALNALAPLDTPTFTGTVFAPYSITINDYTFPEFNGAEGKFLASLGGSSVAWVTPQGLGAEKFLSICSTQYSRTLPAPVTLADGAIANGVSFFTQADLIAAGTTSYNQYNLASTRPLTLTGTSGQANINILGTNYLCSFALTLTATANQFVSNHAATIKLATGIDVVAESGVLRFGDENTVNLNNITITTISGNLNGTFGTTVIDHIRIPYAGTPYFGLRLHHTIRVNFNIALGTAQTYSLQLRRWSNNTIVGSSIAVSRNPDETGQQFVFESYTSGQTDPFVQGGFYFAFVNNSGQTVDFVNNCGILIQTVYQKPINF